MIDKSKLVEVIEKSIEMTDVFIVDIRIGKANDIVVELDSDTSMDIETCEKITRDIEASFDRDIEDYDLEVGSSGLTAPFKVRRQYEKNLGNEIEVLTNDGQKLSGTLIAVNEDSFAIEFPIKKRVEGKKKPVIVNEQLTITYENTKSAKYKITF